MTLPLPSHRRGQTRPAICAGGEAYDASDDKATSGRRDGAGARATVVVPRHDGSGGQSLRLRVDRRERVYCASDGPGRADEDVGGGEDIVLRCACEVRGFGMGDLRENSAPEARTHGTSSKVCAQRLPGQIEGDRAHVPEEVVRSRHLVAHDPCYTARVGPVVRVEAVSKRVRDGDSEGRRTVLAEVSFSIERGELVILRGPSGSGKTTLLAVVGGMLSPTSGEVYLDGEPTSRLREAHRAEVRRRKVGFLFQDLQLIDALTALENVLLPEVPLHAVTRAREDLSLIHI